MKARAWTFTINNPTEQDKAFVKTIEASYIVVGDEVGENGTPHLQGYVYFENARELAGVSESLGGRAHIERAGGSAAQNRAYCTKSAIFFEAGTLPAQGKRNDMKTVREIFQKGGTMLDVIAQCDSVQAVRAAELVRKYVPAPVREPPVVAWYWGKSGVGKTRRAFAEANALGATWISSFETLKWWQGYDGQKCVILDDFRPSACELPYLLRVLDRYPVQVESKGGSTWMVATHIWITSILPPAQMLWAGEESNQLLRRVSSVVEIL